MSSPRILILQQEWPHWSRSRHWSLTSSAYGFEAALDALGIEAMILASPFLPQAEAILGDRAFDQIWIFDLAHIEPFDALLPILERAPVRLGFVIESLSYTDDDYSVAPHLRARRADVLERAARCTHIAVYDEADESSFDQSGAKTRWIQCAVPSKLIRRGGGFREGGPGVFVGAVYGKRIEALNCRAVRDVLLAVRPAESAFPFNALFQLGRLGTCLPSSYPLYLRQLRKIRRSRFQSLLDAFQQGSCVVNLPTLFKGYPGRVVESMAAGVPVVSWRIPRRPRTAALFGENHEMLFYAEDDWDELAGRIRELRDSPRRAGEIADNAREILLLSHTMERRVEELLAWTS